MKLVPNENPKYHSQPYKIALIGEAPGADEETEGRPFVGHSGRLLWNEASKVGIVRDACFVGNVCQLRPPNNKIESFSWGGGEISRGIEALESDLATFKPNLVVLLGNAPLRWATGETSGITHWRGSILTSKQGYKCIATLHPAGILREYSGKTLLNFDLRKARLEGESPNITHISREIRTDLTFDECLYYLQQWRDNHTPLWTDIEGYWDNIWCMGFAESLHKAAVIPLDKWNEPQEQELLLNLSYLLSDSDVPKTFQNVLYDLFCLRYGLNIPVRGVVGDTMLKHWELYCEMKKALWFQASIYSRDYVYWKDERENESRPVRMEYCGKDCIYTAECDSVMTKQLHGKSLEHYKLNLDLLDPLLYMELKGINYDTKHAKEKLDECKRKIYRLQWALNEIAGIRSPDNVSGWVDTLRDTCCFKREANSVNLLCDVLAHTKVTCLHLAVRAVEILKKPLDIESIGELSSLTETALNVESKNQIADYLYRTLNLPIQYKKEHGRKTETETTDKLALLKLWGKTQDPTLKLILTIRALRTRCTSLEARTDDDHRIRCGYNAVGTKTGRLSCYTSPTGSGFNLQTATKKDRDLFLPDDGCWLFQCDLSGADGWTVAAHCKACGDTTMLDDYLYGLKPAKILSLISMHGKQVLSWPREKIKLESKGIDQDDWMYFARKRIQHGTNYGEKENAVSDQILQDSYKLSGNPVFISPSQCKLEQTYYLLRYPGVLSWHRKIKLQLKSRGYIISANGHRRDFFGRHDEYTTFMEACADEPQNNTTYATKLALIKLWKDPENRLYNRESRFRVAPLHTVHDSLIGQFLKEDTTWASTKLHEWFNNPLEIAGQRIVIPFEGGYGPNWKVAGSNEKVGEI